MFTLSHRVLFTSQHAVLCDELSSLGTTLVGDLLDWAKTELDTYLQPIAPDRADPLHLESNLAVPADKRLLDFQNLEESLGSWVTDALNQADALLGQEVDDPTAPNGSGRSLGINAFLRQNILDADRALTVAIADLPFQAFNPTLFQSHDLLTDTTITLTSVKMYGLDTFTKFDPLAGKSCLAMQLFHARRLLYVLSHSHSCFSLLTFQRLASTRCKTHSTLITLLLNLI